MDIRIYTPTRALCAQPYLHLLLVLRSMAPIAHRGPSMIFVISRPRLVTIFDFLRLHLDVFLVGGALHSRSHALPPSRRARRYALWRALRAAILRRAPLLGLEIRLHALCARH